MKETSLITYIRNHVEDDYEMSVLYYSIKDSFVENDFSLSGFSYFYIDGRFLGDSTKITARANYRTPLHALACLLSIRLLMINHKYLTLCANDSLIIASKPKESFLWLNFMSLILDNWDDDEVKMLYQMMENYYYDEEFTDEEKEVFKETIEAPEYRNERLYYQTLAQRTTGVSDNIIGNNAFIEAKIEKFTISKDIVYVGNTAFAYCELLKTLTFEGKVMFGVFPIIECVKLQKIVVPAELVDYYKECLPFYKDLITDNEQQ